jgi:endonuclease/exonuclease/phosphatase family metal-dependent hydrolase
MSPKHFGKKRFLIQSATMFSLASLLFLSSGFEVTDAGKPRAEIRLSSNPSAPDNANAGRFSVITYNIAGLPGIISSAVTKRAPSIAEIGRRLNAFDVVNVQEDFNYNGYLYNYGNSHPFRTQTKGGVPFGDGLNTLSRYPLHDVRRIPWNNCTGADCFTPKGFTYARMKIARNTYVDLYNVHANAYNHLSAAAARRENIRQLSAFITEKSRGQAVIVMGDLNAHYSYRYDNVHQLLTDNGLKDAWVVLMNRDRLPVSVNDIPSSQILLLDNQSESIDKIMYRSNDQIELNISDYQLASELFKDDRKTPLSDHHPVSLVFTWTRKDEKRLASSEIKN